MSLISLKVLGEEQAERLSLDIDESMKKIKVKSYDCTNNGISGQWFQLSESLELNIEYEMKIQVIKDPTNRLTDPPNINSQHNDGEVTIWLTKLSDNKKISSIFQMKICAAVAPSSDIVLYGGAREKHGLTGWMKLKNYSSAGKYLKTGNTILLNSNQRDIWKSDYLSAKTENMASVSKCPSSGKQRQCHDEKLVIVGYNQDFGKKVYSINHRYAFYNPRQGSFLICDGSCYFQQCAGFKSEYISDSKSAQNSFASQKWRDDPSCEHIWFSIFISGELNTAQRSVTDAHRIALQRYKPSIFFDTEFMVLKLDEGLQQEDELTRKTLTAASWFNVWQDDVMTEDEDAALKFANIKYSTMKTPKTQKEFMCPEVLFYVDWSTCNAFCGYNGMHVATLKSEEEKTTLRTIKKGLGAIWQGAKYEVKNGKLWYHWVDDGEAVPNSGDQGWTTYASDFKHSDSHDRLKLSDYLTWRSDTGSSKLGCCCSVEWLN